MPYLYEMHFHTAETSPCAALPAEEGVRALMDSGYSGVCVTDHFHAEWLMEFEGISYEEKIGIWLEGYESAKRCEDGWFHVLLGMELCLPGSYNEFLLYGLTPELLCKTPRLAFFSVEECKTFADRNGIFMAQAHPFRPFMIPCAPRLLHGMEVYNGNMRHQSRNRKAQTYADKRGLTGISGSDFHEFEDVGRGGMWFDAEITSSRDLAKALFSGEPPHSLMISD